MSFEKEFEGKYDNCWLWCFWSGLHLILFFRGKKGKMDIKIEILHWLSSKILVVLPQNPERAGSERPV